MEFTYKEFAERQNISPDYLRVLIHREKIPTGYEVDKERKIIIKKVNAEVEYINPSKLTAEQKIRLNNLYSDLDGNIKQISEQSGIHYTTVYRYFKKQYKKADAARADKGKSRRLTKTQIELARKKFAEWFAANAQKNVSLALYQVKKVTGIKVPRRMADNWAAALSRTHKMKHYYKEFISTETYHHQRDNWTEVKNFMDLVVSDVWKIDDPYVPEDQREAINKELADLKIKSLSSWQKARTKSATAYALVFMDVKTRYILDIEICPHSVTGADVKKGFLNVILNYGDPKQWLLDNGHEFINNDTMDFLYGVHMGVLGEYIETKVEKKILLKEDEKIITSRPHHPQSKGVIERFFRILKDEWAAYSISYSPNQFESRKPGVALSSVQPVQSFEELALSLKQFIETDYVERERSCFLDPGKWISHPENQSRPKTVKEAFNIAYATYNKRDIDEYLLAYYYSDKRKGKFKGGCVKISDPVSKLKFSYVPFDIEAISEYSNQEVTCLIDPKNHAHCWIYKGNKLLSEASDLRYSANAPLTRERAATLGKLQRQAATYEKKKLDKIEEIEKYKINNLQKEETASEENYDAEINDNDFINQEVQTDDDIWNAIDLEDIQ